MLPSDTPDSPEVDIPDRGVYGDEDDCEDPWMAVWAVVGEVDEGEVGDQREPAAERAEGSEARSEHGGGRCGGEEEIIWERPCMEDDVGSEEKGGRDRLPDKARKGRTSVRGLDWMGRDVDV